MTHYTVGECFSEIRNGANIKQGIVQGGIPITRIETLAGGTFQRSRMGYAGIFDESAYAAFVLADEDLLMSHINSLKYLGRTVLYRKEPGETILHGMNLLRLKAKRELLLPAFAELLFRSPKMQAQILKISKKSVNQASFSVSDLKKIPIALPTLEKQRMIVRQMDALRRVIQCKEQELLALEELIKSQFIEMFGDLNVSLKYPVVELGSISGMLSGGTPSSKHPEYFGGNMPFVSTPSLGPNYIDASAAQNWLTESGIANSSTHRVPAYSLMFGNRVGVGKSSINTCEMCTNQDILSFVNIDTSRFDLLFLKKVLDQYEAFFDSQKRGTTIKGIPSDLVKASKVPLVPIDVQRKFVGFVQQSDKSKSVIRQSIQQTQLLFDCLMQTYFAP